jgi:hypothetical protein
MNKFILVFTFVFFLLIVQQSFAATIGYTFNSYSAGEAWETTPANMVDGVLTNYATTNNNGDTQLLNANNNTGTNLGTIISVEIRAYGDYTTAGDEVRLRPVFTGGDGDNHDGAVPSTPGWGTWFDITTDTNAPGTWTWTNVQDLDVDVEHYKSAAPGLVYVGQIDIQVNYTINSAPLINNITSSHSIIKGGDTITFSANTTFNGINDTDVDTLTIYCDTTSTPTAANTDCTGGITSDSTYPYALSCTFAVPTDDVNYTEYCRVYDSTAYSSVVNTSFLTDSTAPSTSIVSVAGDTALTYFDTVNDAATDILISGESNMICRWSPNDVTYSSMSNVCSISGTQANCSVTDALTQGLFNRYTSCQDSLGNEQSSSNNLNVQFYLDYTAPTTSDNSDTAIHVPDYVVTITETDNVDADPTSLYCTSTSAGCNPTTSIDNGGTITYTSSDRGDNYLRYYSTDDAGNTQTTVNKSIRINQLPIFTSSIDDSTIIKGGSTVNVSSVSLDSDAGQTVTLWVCDSTSITSSGCGGGHYCNSTGTVNVSCTFTSELDSATHTWYSYLYDELNEISLTNFSGSYTTDSTSPTLTVNNPTNGSIITQSSITLTVTGDENLGWAGYAINGGSNVTLINISGTQWSGTNSSIADGNYNVTFYGNDTYGNLGTSDVVFFTINTTPADTTPPTLTIHSPINGTYYTSANVLFNLTSDENLSWAGYAINVGTLTNLTNTSPTNWNSTVTLTEGQKNISFYGNDSADNQGNKNLTVYVDLTNPTIISFSCNSSVNDDENITCNANVTDGIELNYGIIGNNASGSWSNSSQISLNGTSDNLTYIITSNNTGPGVFNASIYLFDSSGRTNTTSFSIIVLDNTYPVVENISYVPNSTLDLDPGVQVNVTAGVFEDYNISTVYLMYKNSTAVNWTSTLMTNTTAISYNASFTPQNGTWQFKINATDSAGNENVSSTIEIVVENDVTSNISTTLPSVKSYTLTQAGENKSLGNLIMNNTGDTSLTFNVTINSSTIGERLFLNGTNSLTANYTVASGEIINITAEVNTTSLPVNLYNYSLIIISETGTTTLNKQLNIQNVDGAYLVVTIPTYSSSVDIGDTGIEYIAAVQNLGTAAAENVYLNWTLPSQFSITSGSASRTFSSLSIGGSGTNTIAVSVSGSAANVNVSATVTADGGLNDSETKFVTIGAPTTTTVTTPGGGGSTSGGGGAGTIIYSRVVEIVRGEVDNFEIRVENTNPTLNLEDITLSLSGFFQQYLGVTPLDIDIISPGHSDAFIIDVEAPSYSDYQEHNLTATIRGTYTGTDSSRSYREIQYIKLIIQEISAEETNNTLIEAERAIFTMKSRLYNTEDVEELLVQAREKLEVRKNKESNDLANEIINIKDQALLVDNLIRRIFEAENNPWRSNLLIGNAIKEFDSSNNYLSLKDLVGLDSVFSTGEIRELITLSVAAFERGDYLTALERAEEAKSLLLLERKGNLGFFFYLYWPYISVAIILLSIVGILSFRKYEKSSITRKIEDANKEEENLTKLFRDAQNNYFLGKMGSGEYHKLMDQHNKKLVTLRGRRIKLRNRRIKMLKPRDVLGDLKIEVMQIEGGIQNIQRDYYVNKKIGEKEYKLEFKMQNERLAEIEDERTVIHLSENSKKIPKEKSGDNILEKLKKSFKKKEKENLQKEEKIIKEKIKHMLNKKK